jgi:hypothetical protein
MTKTALKWLIFASTIVGFNALGRAQDADVGKTAYLST